MLSDIIKNILTIDKRNLKENIRPMISGLKERLNSNFDLLKEVNNVDISKNNGFKLDLNIINNIFANVLKEPFTYGDVTLSTKDDEKKIIYGKEIFDVGNVIVINEGNFYVTLELLLRNLLAGNTTIFVNSGYMFGSNNFLINEIESILKTYDISRNLFQIYVTEDYDEVLSYNANIDLIICTGDHFLQNMILRKSKVRTIITGYDNFDLYIESKVNLDFLNEILKTGLNINLYIKDDLNLNHSKAMLVHDINEAISQINYTGNRYSSAIFTSNSLNASKFINEIKSKIITINTSPTIERILDIKQTELMNEKIVIYPLSFNFDNSGVKINLNEIS